jgi:hypothetical protein
MDMPLRRLDLCHVLTATATNQHRLAGFAAVLADARRAERLADAQCRLCFYYDSRVGGCVCTTSPCGGCAAPCVLATPAWTGSA